MLSGTLRPAAKLQNRLFRNRACKAHLPRNGPDSRQIERGGLTGRSGRLFFSTGGAEDYAEDHAQEDPGYVFRHVPPSRLRASTEPVLSLSKDSARTLRDGVRTNSRSLLRALQRLDLSQVDTIAGRRAGAQTVDVGRQTTSNVLVRQV